MRARKKPLKGKVIPRSPQTERKLQAAGAQTDLLELARQVIRTEAGAIAALECDESGGFSGLALHG